MTHDLTADRAGQFARIALGHVAREYPHKADHVMTGDGDIYTPRAVHSIFFGSFDWHSCVHGYWLLARVRRLFPDLPEAARTDALFADAFTPAKVEAERAYLDRPAARGFERPYGWAWLLMLAAELRLGGSPHEATLRPLAEAFVRRFHDFLPLLTYPVRAGTHANTAFALVLAARYAEVTGDASLRALLADRARDWFGADRDAQGWEPGGDDFLSPTLMEASAMAALMPPGDFRAWLAGFLPRLAAREPATLFSPAIVSDRSDGKIAHLDGLNLSRAWAFRAIADASDQPANLRDAADRHLAAALDEVAGDYMGEHWLASFALLALTG
ncbi:DUF2891 domain-containing protein [Sphingomonas sp. CL5.1]|uniref:DUF2891 domain-containing protein n=1 Tax=Sphingomonas sp. CL5.1 TaxID=2653203 RepID=UPI0015842D49|nr:DUF2891 domain-containing protein [Sphingomonas sp. CL5.1]QKR98999.1 DUF2891 domain-containing protein [Sphingomonas sp. CL5.1]